MNSTSTIEQILQSILNLLSPKEVSAKFTSSTTTGTIAAGATKISFINVGAANGTVTSNGTDYTLTPNEVITLDPGFARRNDKVTFDATGTTFKIIEYRF